MCLLISFPVLNFKLILFSLFHSIILVLRLQSNNAKMVA